jgi:hypothetical protein
MTMGYHDASFRCEYATDAQAYRGIYLSRITPSFTHSAFLLRKPKLFLAISQLRRVHTDCDIRHDRDILHMP